MVISSIALLLLLSSVASVHGKNSIPSPFTYKQYHVERNFVQDNDARDLLRGLVHKGIPGFAPHDSSFTKEAVKKIGDGGNTNVEQHSVEDFAVALQRFATDEYHQQQAKSTKESLVYYLEQLDGDPLLRSAEMIEEVVPNSILDDGGTIHLYMSSPGAAALDNHTDTTDIVVVQLDGEKEWLLCSEPDDVDEPKSPTLMRNGSQPTQPFDVSRKLDSCSTYSEFEIDTFECERTVLKPGDALFLPRRVVHSARALSDQYSAHLTFGFNEDTVCWEHRQLKQTENEGNRELDKLGIFCDQNVRIGCDASCDAFCNRSCDKLRVFSCDSGCKLGCDASCDLCIL